MIGEQGHYAYIPQNKSVNMHIGILVDNAANRAVLVGTQGQSSEREQKSTKKGRKDETNHKYFLSQQKIS